MHQVNDAVSAVAGAVRYGGVLAVWSALFLVQPRLALQILRERRADSPLPRLSPHGA